MLGDKNSSRRLRAVLSAITCLGAGYFLAAGVAAKGRAVIGIWGARDAILTIGPKHSKIELGHAETAIDGPVKTDAKGRFSVTGKYYEYRPGPDRIDAPAATREAHIKGHVRGETLILTMEIGGEPSAQQFTFKKGQHTKLLRLY